MPTHGCNFAEQEFFIMHMTKQPAQCVYVYYAKTGYPFFRFSLLYFVSLGHHNGLRSVPLKRATNGSVNTPANIGNSLVYALSCLKE